MPQFKLIEIIAVLVALAVLVGAVTAAWKMADSKGYSRGQAETNAIWQARESKELAAANAMILIESDKARTAERAAQVATTQANDARRKADEAAKARIKPVADTVATGLGRMCDPGTAAGQSPAVDPARTVAADPERLAGTDRSDVLAQLGIDLSNEAARADDYARKLKQAVALLKLDREVCQ